MTDAIFDFLVKRMADPDTNWSVGSFGAIAEFTRDPEEPVAVVRDDTSLIAVTARGGIRIKPLAQMRLYASETAVGRNWNHRISLCLPQRSSAMGRRAVLTELGPDGQAFREEDKGGVLFDLGLNCLQIDALIRTRDPDLITLLRNHTGQSLLEPGNDAMAAILAANPHRVFAGQLGRIEVFQPVPPPDGKSPDGPHTHVLPKLLAHKRTHAATEPVPIGFVPCAHCYPPHPLKDEFGQSRLFNPEHHASFQAMLHAFGDPATVALKRRVVAAVAAGDGPAGADIPDSRLSRATVRVALRQLRARGEQSPALDAWMSAHDHLDEIDAIPEPSCS